MMRYDLDAKKLRLAPIKVQVILIHAQELRFSPASTHYTEGDMRICAEDQMPNFVRDNGAKDCRGAGSKVVRKL